jgi:hypothetical protein
MLRISSSRVLALENGAAAIKRSSDKIDASAGGATREPSVSDSLNAKKSLALSTANQNKVMRLNLSVLLLNGN